MEIENHARSIGRNKEGIDVNIGIDIVRIKNNSACGFGTCEDAGCLCPRKSCYAQDFFPITRIIVFWIEEISSCACWQIEIDNSDECS
jgi:hypothetical protein